MDYTTNVVDFWPGRHSENPAPHLDDDFPEPGSFEPDLDAPELEFPDDGSLCRDEDAGDTCKGVIKDRSSGTILGASGAAKTTFAIDLGFHVAHGRDFYGRRVQQGPVLYVGYEGLGGLRNRIAAAVRKHGHPGRMFARLVMPPTLNKTRAGQQGVNLIVQAAKKLERAAGVPVRLIFVDTKARATAGDDENAAADAAHYIQQRIGAIIRATNASVVTIHHTGKDDERGGRGSGALAAGDDFRLLIKKRDGIREVWIDKARDDGDGILWFSFELETLVLRQDADGDDVTACTIKEIQKHNDLEKHDAKKLPPAAQRALEILHRMYADKRAFDVPLSMIGYTGKHSRNPGAPIVEIDPDTGQCPAMSAVVWPGPDGQTDPDRHGQPPLGGVQDVRSVRCPNTEVAYEPKPQRQTKGDMP